MAARKRFVFFITNQKNRESTPGHSLHWRNLRQRKAGEFFSAIQQRPAEGREKGLAEPGIFAESRIVISGFTEIRERCFRDDGFDAKIGRAGLQRNARAHGLPKCKNVIWRANRPPRAMPLNGFTAFHKVRVQRVNDRARVVALKPAIGSNGAFARAVAPRVHHDHTVSGPQQKFRLADDAGAIVRHAMKKQDPRAVGIGRGDLPAAEMDAVSGKD